MDSHNPALVKPNMAKETYDQRKHGAFVLSRIRHFDQAYYWALGSTAGTIAISVVIYKWTVWPFALIAAGIGKQYSSSAWQDFHDSLRELEEIYSWCIKNQKGNITLDKVVCDLFESIAPLKDSESLIKLLPKLAFVSERFRNVLSAPPHNFTTVTQMSEPDIKTYMMAPPDPSKPRPASFNSFWAEANYFIFNEKAEPYWGVHKHTARLFKAAYKLATTSEPAKQETAQKAPTAAVKRS